MQMCVVVILLFVLMPFMSFYFVIAEVYNKRKYSFYLLILRKNQTIFFISKVSEKALDKRVCPCYTVISNSSSFRVLCNSESVVKSMSCVSS